MSDSDYPTLESQERERREENKKRIKDEIQRVLHGAQKKR